MPAVHGVTVLRLIKSIRLYDLMHSHKWSGISYIFSIHFPVVRSAEIILRPSTADGGELSIAIEIKLDFTFPPPVIVVNPPSHHSTNIMTASLNLIQNGINFLVRKWIHPSELSMKISAVLRNIRQRIVDLVKTGFISSGLRF